MTTSRAILPLLIFFAFGCEDGICRDEIYRPDGCGGSRTIVTCDVGAHVELVGDTTICHCPPPTSKVTPGPSSSAPLASASAASSATATPPPNSDHPNPAPSASAP